MTNPANESRLEALLAETGRMRRLAAALLRGADQADVDDVVQDASIAVLTHEPSRGFVPWLRSIVRHLAIDASRRNERRAMRERTVARAEAVPSAEDSARRFTLHHAVVAAVESLPPPQRDVVLRRFFDEAKPARIAADLGVPVSTVKTRLQRALAQLREKLRRDEGDQFELALLALVNPARTATQVAETGIAATKAASSSAVIAVAGAVAMSSKAKVALAAGVLAVVGLATFQIVARFRSNETTTGVASRTRTTVPSRESRSRSSGDSATSCRRRRWSMRPISSENAIEPSADRRANSDSRS